MFISKLLSQNKSYHLIESGKTFNGSGKIFKKFIVKKGENIFTVSDW